MILMPERRGDRLDGCGANSRRPVGQPAIHRGIRSQFEWAGAEKRRLADRRASSADRFDENGTRSFRIHVRERQGGLQPLDIDSALQQIIQRVDSALVLCRGEDGGCQDPLKAVQRRQQLANRGQR